VKTHNQAFSHFTSFCFWMYIIIEYIIQKHVGSSLNIWAET